MILTENKTKKNKQFQILSALGIMFVVFGHIKNDMGLFLSNIFPYYSFHMGLFAFISGFFFCEHDLFKYVKKKIKKLLIPYFIYRLFYAILINCLNSIGIINYGDQITLYNLFIAPFTTMGNQYFFQLSSWFLIAIFFVQILNMLVYKILKFVSEKYRIFLIFFGYLILALCINKLDKSGIFYTIDRVLFLLPFYQFGYIYKNFENKIDNTPNYLYFGILFTIQMVLLQIGNLGYNLNLLSFNQHIIVNLIATFTGILFWVRISKILSNLKLISENKYVKNIGDNTFCIMMNHIFCFFIINIVIYALFVINKYTLNINTPFFNSSIINEFKESVWFTFGSTNVVICLLYGIFGIIFPIFVKDKIINFMRCKYEKI